MNDQDIKELQDRVAMLEQESLGTDPAIHPLTAANLKYQMSFLGGSTAEARSHLSSNQSIPINNGGVPQKINLDTNDFASGITWDATNFRFTCTTAGKYIVTLLVGYQANQQQDGVAYGAFIYKNGSADAVSYNQAAVAATNNLSAVVSDIVSLAVSDYIECYAYTSSNSTINIVGASNSTFGAIAKV